jgi:hypothetical protein
MDWNDLDKRSEIRQDREESMKELTGRMWAEVRRKGDTEEGMSIERRKRERKRRARLGNARARARLKEGMSERDEGQRSEMDDLGIRRSPKRDKEALLAMIARKKRRIRGVSSISGRFI